jgi:hypothetical protein
MRIRWAGHIALMDVRLNAYRSFEGKPLGKKLFGRLRRRENKINKDCSEMDLGDERWMKLAEELVLLYILGFIMLHLQFFLPGRQII